VISGFVHPDFGGVTFCTTAKLDAVSAEQQPGVFSGIREMAATNYRRRGVPQPRAPSCRAW
jgi:hypothetical protein